MASRPFLIVDNASEPPESPVYDVYQLAEDAKDRLEQFQRAAWRELSEQEQDSRLQHAIELIQRIQGIRSGEIPVPTWGD